MQNKRLPEDFAVQQNSHTPLPIWGRTSAVSEWDYQSTSMVSGTLRQVSFDQKRVDSGKGEK